MNGEKLKISFLGAAQEVTGSNYLLEVNSSDGSTRILIDCGLFQGTKINEEKNKKPFSYEPSAIGALIVTHAHLDHIGRIPKLAREGFQGKIFSTPPTKDLANLMLIDSLGVLKKEAEREKKDLIYNERDVEKTMTQWETVNYHQEFFVNDLKIVLKDAGHILGSSMVEISVGGKKIVFSGDLGNSPEPLLNETERIKDADYLMIESTYGDRIHEGKEEADLKLERVIEDTISKKGVLMIPAFSLERTQKILFKINEFIRHGRISDVPVFLDSPLSIQATKIYKENSRYYNDKAQEIAHTSGNLFNFPKLKTTLTTEESKKIDDIMPPKIIIAGSGMLNGGRILRHLQKYINDSKNTLLFVSYQAPGSLGRELKEGIKKINIFGEEFSVDLRIESIEGYSAHADLNMLFDFIEDSAKTLKKVFMVHGELKSSLFLVQRVRDHLGIDAISPKFGDYFEIEI